MAQESWFSQRKRDIFKIGAILAILLAPGMAMRLLENQTPLFSPKGLAITTGSIFGAFFLAFIFYAFWDRLHSTFRQIRKKKGAD